MMFEYLTPTVLHENINLYLIALISIGSFVSLLFMLLAKERLFKVMGYTLIATFVALTYLLLDAPDVAMTEAAIGVCVSTVILILFISRLKEEKEQKFDFFRFMLCIISSLSILYLFYHSSFFMPEFGNPSNPVVSNSANYYVQNTEQEIKTPAYVAAILASYRSFDTLGETIVVFIAGIGVYLIMGVKDEK